MVKAAPWWKTPVVGATLRAAAARALRAASRERS
jgi:hypothetical protein